MDETEACVDRPRRQYTRQADGNQRQMRSASDAEVDRESELETKVRRLISQGQSANKALAEVRVRLRPVLANLPRPTNGDQDERDPNALGHSPLGLLLTELLFLIEDHTASIVDLGGMIEV